MDPQARVVSLPGALSAHEETEAQRGRQLAQPVAQLGSLLALDEVGGWSAPRPGPVQLLP